MDNLKKCLIRQPAGIGDIIFTRKIYNHYITLGYDVIYPIYDNLIWMNDYFKSNKYVGLSSDFYQKKIYNNNDIIKTDNFIFLPLQNADKIYRHRKDQMDDKI